VAERVDLRAPTLADAEAVVMVLDAYAAATSGLRTTAEEVCGWWTAPNFDPSWQARVAEVSGAVVGYADISDPNGDAGQLWIDLRVPDDGRRVEADDVLLKYMLERAGSHAALVAVLRAFCSAEDGHTIALLERHAFHVVRHSFRMTMSLTGPLAEPSWPTDICVRTADPRTDLRSVYDAYRESFADAWGGVVQPYDDFVHDWSVLRFDPGLWFLAEEGGELAGVALCLPQRGGEPDLGWVSILGVRRPWRRRGLGRALLLHAFAELRARGKTRAGLGVDAGSPTGAVGLYESVGMIVTRRSVTLERPV
jgi:GNAT superfamily N-acetyltransferase